MKLVPRHLTKPLTDALASSRIVNIVGPRQDGKSTLVRDLVKTAAYVTLDDDGARGALELDPYTQLKTLSDDAAASGLPVVIDEVQRLPQITLALKRIVDQDQRRGHFLLTGSSDIFTSGKAIDSLAGRVSTLTLRPFSAAEIAGSGPCRILDAAGEARGQPDSAPILKALPGVAKYTRADVINLIVRGGFPEFRGLKDRDRATRCRSYTDSIIERDFSAIHAVRKPDAVRRLIHQVAQRTAQELNPQTLAGQVDLKRETLNDYVDVLTRLGIVLRLGAWASSGPRREIKASKLHFLDTGLATALRGEDSTSFGIDGDPTALGALFETYVFTELEKSLPFQDKNWSLWHWRSKGREVDIVAEAPGRHMALFEMKLSANVSVGDFRHLEWFMAEGPGKGRKCVAFVVYTGEHLLSFGPGLIALPVSMFWSFPR